MKPTLTLITGWAHGADCMQPLAGRLAAGFDVQILTGADVLTSRRLPESEILIGWSMGGLLALDLLPESCKRLVLISSTAQFCAAADYLCGAAEKALRRMAAQLKRHPDAVLDAFYKNANSPTTDPECSPEQLVAGLDYLLGSTVRKKVPAIGKPVLLLHGTADQIIPAAASEWLHAHLPDSRLELFEGQGHALPVRQPDRLARAIRTFLA